MSGWRQVKYFEGEEPIWTNGDGATCWLEDIDGVQMLAVSDDGFNLTHYLEVDFVLGLVRPTPGRTP